MRIDRSQINSCHVFDKIKVDLAVRALEKIYNGDKCARIGGIFTVEEFVFVNCSSTEFS